MFWLLKRDDDGSFEIVDEDDINGVAGVGRTVTVSGHGYTAVLKACGRKNFLLDLKEQMERGASTPDAKRRNRKNVSDSISLLYSIHLKF